MIDIFGKPKLPSRFLNCNLIRKDKKEINVCKIFIFDKNKMTYYLQYEDLNTRHKKGRRIIKGYMLVKNQYINTGKYSKLICQNKRMDIIYNNVHIDHVVSNIKDNGQNFVIAKFSSSDVEYIDKK